jgi:cobalamin biosynthesis Mg chelatase CobN
MFGTRHSPTRAPGLSTLFLSVLVLLAFCCLPALAQASSSAGYEYQNAVPTPTGSSPGKSNLSGGSGSTSGIGSPAKSGGKGGKGSSGANGSKGNGASTGVNGNGQGSSGGGSGGNSATSGEQISGAAPGTDSGGSSPLVPILIAIVLLAGGSVAFVMIRRRRAAGKSGQGGKPGHGAKPGPGQGGASGAPPSPEAG